MVAYSHTAIISNTSSDGFTSPEIYYVLGDWSRTFGSAHDVHIVLEYCSILKMLVSVRSNLRNVISIAVDADRLESHLVSGFRFWSRMHCVNLSGRTESGV